MCRAFCLSSFVIDPHFKVFIGIGNVKHYHGYCSIWVQKSSSQQIVVIRGTDDPFSAGTDEFREMAEVIKEFI